MAFSRTGDFPARDVPKRPVFEPPPCTVPKGGHKPVPKRQPVFKPSTRVSPARQRNLAWSLHDPLKMLIFLGNDPFFLGHGDSRVLVTWPRRRGLYSSARAVPSPAGQSARPALGIGTTDTAAQLRGFRGVVRQKGKSLLVWWARNIRNPLKMDLKQGTFVRLCLPGSLGSSGNSRHVSRAAEGTGWRS